MMKTKGTSLDKNGIPQNNYFNYLNFLTYVTESVLFLAVLRQLTHDVNSDVKTINFSSDVIFAPSQKKSQKNTKRRWGKVIMRRKMSKIKEIRNDK